MNAPSLDRLIKDCFFKCAEIKLNGTKEKYEGYLVGVRLPYHRVLMLYFISYENADKYIRSGNKKWVEQLPYDLIDKVELTKNSNTERENALREIFVKSTEQHWEL